MSENENESDLTNKMVPLKLVLGAFIWLFTTFGTAASVVFWAGTYKSDTDSKIIALEKSDALQVAQLGQLPTRITRMEMILCTTEDPVRNAQCDRLGVN